MSGWLILADLLPLIIFVVVDALAGMRWGILSAIGLAVVMLLMEQFLLDDIHQSTWLIAALIVVMGFISLRLRQSKYFKLQPAILSLVFAIILAWYQWFDTPLMVQMVPKMASLLPPEHAAMAGDARFLEQLGRMSGQLVGVFLINAALLWWAAVKLNNWVWLILRATSVYVMIILLVFGNLVLAPP